MVQNKKSGLSEKPNITVDELKNSYIIPQRLYIYIFSIIWFTQNMKTNKPKLKTEKNKTQHSTKSSAYNECCTWH